MQLRTYMEDQGLTLSQMGRMLAEVEPALSKPIHPGNVRRHLIGEDYPSADLVRRYESATKGLVGPRDWHELKLAVTANPDLLKSPPQLRRRRPGDIPPELVHPGS